MKSKQELPGFAAPVVLSKGTNEMQQGWPEPPSTMVNPGVFKNSPPPKPMRFRQFKLSLAFDTARVQLLTFPIEDDHPIVRMLDHGAIRLQVKALDDMGRVILHGSSFVVEIGDAETVYA